MLNTGSSESLPASAFPDQGGATPCVFCSWFHVSMCQHADHVSWVKEGTASSHTLRIVISSPGCVLISSHGSRCQGPLPGLVGNCCRREAFGFKSHQMPRLCPPIPSTDGRPAAYLAGLRPDQYTQKCPLVTCVFSTLMCSCTLLSPHLSDV